MSIEAPEALLDDIGSSNYKLADLRSLMPELSMEELAVAGHAVALSNWHRVNFVLHMASPLTGPVSGTSKGQEHM